LPLIERAASDERNFVKKGVSWALRGVGRRNRALHAQAIALAHRLADSSDPTKRWLGKDALRDLTSATLAKKLAAAK
jgi:3-methyladenine DNA glycosylase AlkD